MLVGEEDPAAASCNPYRSIKEGLVAILQREAGGEQGGGRHENGDGCFVASPLWAATRGLPSDCNQPLLSVSHNVCPPSPMPASHADGPSSGSSVALSAALSCALCLIHRLKSAPSRTRPALSSRPRILCLMGSPDVPMQYIPIMNAIFSAQVSGLVSVQVPDILGVS